MHRLWGVQPPCADPPRAGGGPEHVVSCESTGIDDEMSALIPVDVTQVRAAAVRKGNRSSSSIPTKSEAEWVTTAVNYVVPSTGCKRALWHRRVTKEKITGEVIEDLDIMFI